MNKEIADKLAYRPIIDLAERKILGYTDMAQIEETGISSCLNGYIMYSPVAVINSMRTTINKLDNTLELIKGDLDGDADFANVDIDKLINRNRTIDGNSIYEIYSIIKNDKDNLKNFLTKYKKTYYGDMNDDDIYTANDSIVEEMKNYELSNKIEKINYTSLAFDSYLNSILEDYANKICEYDMSLYAAGTISNDNIEKLNADIQTVLKSDFYTKSKQVEKYYDKYNNEINTYSIEKLFNQCITLRKEMNDTIDANSKIKVESNYADMLYQLKIENTNKAFESIQDLLKGTSLQIISKCKYNKAFEKCEYIKNIYKNL